jgi:hypothetical protein
MPASRARWRQHELSTRAALAPADHWPASARVPHHRDPTVLAGVERAIRPDPHPSPEVIDPRCRRAGEHQQENRVSDQAHLRVGTSQCREVREGGDQVQAEETGKEPAPDSDPARQGSGGQDKVSREGQGFRQPSYGRVSECEDDDRRLPSGE